MEVLERHFIRFLIGAGREREELGKVRKYKLQKTKNTNLLYGLERNLEKVLTPGRQTVSEILI